MIQSHCGRVTQRNKDGKQTIQYFVFGQVQSKLVVSTEF